MPGRVYVDLFEVASDQYGYVTTDDARARGIDAAQLRIMCHRGQLERVAHGIYRFPLVPESPLDHYMEAVLWPRTPGALSHTTALDLHDLCDVNPDKIHLSVPAGYRLRRDLPAAYELHRRDLDPADVTRHEDIPIVGVYRAIVDGIEIGLGDHLIDQAIGAAQRRGLVAPAELRALSALRHRASLGQASGTSR